MRRIQHIKNKGEVSKEVRITRRRILFFVWQTSIRRILFRTIMIYLITFKQHRLHGTGIYLLNSFFNDQYLDILSTTRAFHLCPSSLETRIDLNEEYEILSIYIRCIFSCLVIHMDWFSGCELFLFHSRKYNSIIH